jgi:hypothetical protein
MKNKIKNHVRFKGDFNKEVPDEPLGRDLAEFITQQLRQRNYTANPVRLKDSGFAVKVLSDSVEYTLVITGNVSDEGCWEIRCQRAKRKAVRLGSRSNIIEWQNLLNVLDEILCQEKTIADIQWYTNPPRKWPKRFYHIIIAISIFIFVMAYIYSLKFEEFTSRIENYLFGLLVLSLCGGFLFALTFGFLPEIRKQKTKTKKCAAAVYVTLLFLGFMGFFSGFLAACGMLNWIPEGIELPLADIKSVDVDGEGKLFTASGFYNRIQIYGTNGDFIRGWSVTGFTGGKIKMKIINENEVEIASMGDRKILVFNENGNLLRFTNFAEDRSFFYSYEHNGRRALDPFTGYNYYMQGWLFPEIIQHRPDGEKKIGKNAIYLFPFQGPAQGWVTLFIGMVLFSRLDKKKKRQNTR